MAQGERATVRVGQVLDRQFRLDGLLGAGGMGEAYVAEQLGMDRRAVVKLLHAHLVRADQPFRERFAREARVVARLNHPNIVQIYATGETPDGVPYLAMEFVEGHTLKAELQRWGALDEARVVSIARQICNALTEAHRLGIVHRDLKPENIMVVSRRGLPDQVKLLDFGIAKLGGASEASRLTRSGMVFGTPQYMAPEQIRGTNADARTDLYALGLVLYELLAGEPAISGDSEFDVLTRQVTETPPSLHSVGREVTPELEHILFKCLEKTPEQRWSSAAELDQALAAASSRMHLLPASTRPIASEPLPPQRSGPVPSSRNATDARRPAPPAPPPASAPQVIAAPNTEGAAPPPPEYQPYTNIYDMLPLPRVLKPFAPWIVSLIWMVVMISVVQLLTRCYYPH
jgi:eukaryotic-like serine/threonine-protein kinase